MVDDKLQATGGPGGRKTIFVTGATGHQGGHLARLLLQRGHRVRALTRDPGQLEAIELQQMGASVKQGDFRAPESIVAHARGADAAFLMATPQTPGGAAEEAREAIATADALREAGVPWIVYASVAGASLHTGIPHFDSKVEVERHLREADVRHAVVAPVSFMEDLLDRRETMRRGRLEIPLPATRKLQVVALDDLAQLVARVLLDPSRFDGARLEVASDEVTPRHMALTIGRIAGVDLEVAPVDPSTMAGEDPAMARMWEWLRDTGYAVDIPRLHREFPDIAWRSFADWAQDQDWAIARTASPEPGSPRGTAPEL